MKIYKVGGAVRDELLGLKPRDLDFLVINSSPEDMRKQGFIQVGQNYEVFLHPETKDEYVLAVDLKADLARRDLTINSMAKDQDGNLIDFFNSKKDLDNRILRHTSIHFSDDPLRIYRVARFKAQYPDFSIAQETLDLCRSLVNTNEFRLLNGERILSEFKDSLAAAEPENFFITLEAIGALTTHFECIREWKGLNEKALNGLDSLHLFAFLVRKNTGQEIDLLARRLLIQNDWIEAGHVASQVHSLPVLTKLKSEDFINFFYAIDAFRKPHLIKLIVRLFGENGGYLSHYFELVNKVTIKEIDAGFSGKDIGEAIRKLRIRKLGESL